MIAINNVPSNLKLPLHVFSQMGVTHKQEIKSKEKKDVTHKQEIKSKEKKDVIRKECILSPDR